MNSVSDTDTGPISGGGSDSGGIPTWVWILVAALVIVIIGGVVFMVCRKQGEDEMDPLDANTEN